MTPLDTLLLELIPVRPTPVEPGTYADGPTARWMDLEREREKWLLLAEIGDDDEAAVA